MSSKDFRPYGNPTDDNENCKAFLWNGWQPGGGVGVCLLHLIHCICVDKLKLVYIMAYRCLSKTTVTNSSQFECGIQSAPNQDI